MAPDQFKHALLGLLRHAHRAQNAFLRDLDTTERAAAGAPDRWSAKDHVAHLAFWRGRLVVKLKAVLRNETPPGFEDFQSLNVQVFEENRHRPWHDVLLDDGRSYAAQTACIARLIEEDLVAFNRFDWVPDGGPLYGIVMGYSYEHTQQHIAQFHLDRGYLAKATEIHEAWVGRVVQAQSPAVIKAFALYNLACFYATHAQLLKASTTLRQAFRLYPGPRLRELAGSDPDLVALKTPMTAMSHLETRRLLLVPFSRSDADAVLAGVRQSNWSAGYPTEGDVEIARMVAKSPDDSNRPDSFGTFKVVERESGLVIGGAGFLGPPDTAGAVEIGYGLAPEWRSRGLATEAVLGLLAFAWSQPSVRRVFATTDLSNKASARVLEKAGMSRVRMDKDLMYYESATP